MASCQCQLPEVQRSEFGRLREKSHRRSQSCSGIVLVRDIVLDFPFSAIADNWHWQLTLTILTPELL